MTEAMGLPEPPPEGTAMSAAFRDLTGAAIDDPEVRCLLLRGEGRSFSSGRDTTQLGTRPELDAQALFAERREA